jgi:threonine aldolase
VLDFGVPATNMVFLSLSQEINLETNKIVGKLQEFGILVGLTGPRSFRLVLHYWVDDIGVERTIDAFRRAVI